MAKKKRRDRPSHQSDKQPRVGVRESERIDRRRGGERGRAGGFDTFRGTPGSSLGPDNDSVIDEASAESFPASDPPAWTRNGL